MNEINYTFCKDKKYIIIINKYKCNYFFLKIIPIY